MRRSRRLALAALLAVAAIGLTGVPASAEPSEWEFTTYPVTLHPGSTLTGGAELDFAPPHVFLLPTSRRVDGSPDGVAVQRLFNAVSACGRDPGYSLAVLDSAGRVRSSPQSTLLDEDGFSFHHTITVAGATPEVGPGVDRTPRSFPAVPGPHWVRVSCTQRETTPALVAVCVRFDVDPERPVRWREALSSRRDPCPGAGRVLADLVGTWLGTGILPRFRAGAPPGLVVPDASTTTTTSAPGAPSPKPSPIPGGGGDTSAPTVGAVGLTGSTYCQDVSVSASVADAVGVTSAKVSWSGAPGSGSVAMSASGSSWSVVISPAAGFAGPGTLTVTVTARDAAGNEGSGSSSIELTLC